MQEYRRSFLKELLLSNLTKFEYCVLFKLLLAAVCGAIIGFEREMRGRPAGLKTFSLVCLGSTLIMVTNDYIFRYVTGGTGDITRMAAQVVSGIGFLGAGSIMVTGHNQITGLTTAAALWVTAALGIAIGSGFYFGALSGLAFIYAASLFFRYLDKKIIERSRIMKIYVEGKNEMFMLKLVDYFDQNNIRVLALQRKSENKWYAEDTCATIELDLGKRSLHKELLEGIRKMEDLRYVEEI